MMILAIVLILGQALVCLLLLRAVRSFGAYTETNKELHEANLAVLSHLDRVIPILLEADTKRELRDEKGAAVA